ncbi:MAG TPA: hypothetical protein VKZ53_19290 [Candidatus Angelobacter sp.]|nr:hypothetical protein [Candidatus Angelobacter sp.]
MTTHHVGAPQKEEIREALLQILGIGLLRIRMLGNDGLADECSIEADHLHNLLELVRSCSMELLRYYYHVERPCFLQGTSLNTEEFKTQWDRLGRIIEAFDRQR